MNGLTIRFGKVEESQIIASFNILHAREYEGMKLDAYTAEKGVRHRMENSSFGFYIVAELGGVIIGSMSVSPEWSDWVAGSFWWIQNVYVKKDFRRRGVFKSMNDFLCQLAQQDKSCAGLRMYVERENIPAIHAHTKQGWEETHYAIFEKKL